VSPKPGPPPLEPGKLVTAGYEVVRLLGRGRKLDVYDAWSEARSCRCVVKTLPPDFMDDRGARRRLIAEGRLLKRLTHPYIVRCYEVIDVEVPLVVLETLTGETLDHVLERAHRLSARDAAWLGLHLCSALGYLHGRGWLHLDLKPSNIIVEGGRAKLIDMSIARRPGRSRAIAGTRDYMSPEQITGDDPLGPASDVWGLGGVLFDALVGDPAFDHGPLGGRDAFAGEPEGEDEESDPMDPEDYLQIAGPAPSVASRRRVPRALAALVDSCLARDPQRRPGIAAVGDALVPIAGVDPKRVLQPDLD
jgi:eukaryotic-like serine/threonine-protein kinase